MTREKTHYFMRRFLMAAGAACALSISAMAANTGYIAGDVVNVREGPGTNYDRVEQLARGREVTITGEEDGWYQVKWNDSRGYILMEFVSTSVSVEEAASRGPNATVTGGTINIRSGPGTNYDRITKVTSGKRVAILNKADDWYEISFDGWTGFIMRDYLLPDDGTVSQSASRPAPAPAEPEDTSGNASVTGGTINVRTGPGTNYDRIAKVKTGKRVNMEERDGLWFRVSFDGKSGYILGDYLSPDPGVMAQFPEPEEPEIYAMAEEPADEEPVVVDTAEDSSVASASFGGSNSRTGLITGGTINVRTGPSTDYDRVAKFYTGKRVNILDERDGWFLVNSDGVTGYVLGDYVLEGVSLVSSSVAQNVVSMSMQYLGTSYVYGGSAPGGFDCSGFSSYLYRQFGYSLPHSASAQYSNCGHKVSRSELLPGDLVFFTDGSGSITHVGIYIGGGDVIHARYSVGRVTINNLSESYYNRNYVGAVRIA